MMMARYFALDLLLNLLRYAVYFPVLYFVVRAAVRAALREHRAALSQPVPPPVDSA